MRNDISNAFAFLFEVGTSILILWGIGRLIGAIATFFDERKRQKKEREEAAKREAERQKWKAEARQKREAEARQKREAEERQKREAEEREKQEAEITAQWKKHPLFQEIFTMCDSAIQSRINAIKTDAYHRDGDRRYGGDGSTPLPWSACTCIIKIEVGYEYATVSDLGTGIVYNGRLYARCPFDDKYETMNHAQRETLIVALCRSLLEKYGSDKGVNVSRVVDKYTDGVIMVNLTNLLPAPVIQKIPLPK